MTDVRTDPASLVLDHGLKMLRVIERLDEEQGRQILLEELIGEITTADEALQRPVLPEGFDAKSVAGYRRPSELVRVRRICDIVQPDERVLDIGIGRGYVMSSLFINATPSYYCGIDISDRFIGQAHDLAVANGVDDSAIHLETRSADDVDSDFLALHRPNVILLFEVLEHVPDAGRTLKAIASAMTDETLVFSVPIQGRIEACWGHKSVFDVAAILELVENAGLQVCYAEALHNTWGVYGVKQLGAASPDLSRFKARERPDQPGNHMTFVPIRSGSIRGSDESTALTASKDVSASSNDIVSFATHRMGVIRFELSFSDPSAVRSITVRARDADGATICEWRSSSKDRLDSRPRSFALRLGQPDDTFDVVDEGVGEVADTTFSVDADEAIDFTLHRSVYAPWPEDR